VARALIFLASHHICSSKSDAELPQVAGSRGNESSEFHLRLLTLFLPTSYSTLHGFVILEILGLSG
jgi:hypothetical protein